MQSAKSQHLEGVSIIAMMTARWLQTHRFLPFMIFITAFRTHLAERHHIRLEMKALIGNRKHTCSCPCLPIYNRSLIDHELQYRDLDPKSYQPAIARNMFLKGRLLDLLGTSWQTDSRGRVTFKHGKSESQAGILLSSGHCKDFVPFWSRKTSGTFHPTRPPRGQVGTRRSNLSKQGFRGSSCFHGLRPRGSDVAGPPTYFHFLSLV